MTAAAAALPAANRAAKLRALQDRAVRHVRNGVGGPYGSDPALSLVADPRTQDVGGWWRAAGQRSAAAAALGSRAAALAPLAVQEAEPRGVRGRNDSLRTAQPVAGFGTRGRANPTAVLTGGLAAERLAAGAVQDVPPSTEDDGTFENARDTGISNRRAGIRTTGRLGDAVPVPGQPAGEDLDLYELTLRAGDLVDVQMRRTDDGGLEPLALLVDADGNLVAFPDFAGDPGESTLQAAVRAAGTYYVVAIGWTVIDLGSGEVTLPEGPYSMQITARRGDRDVYAVQAQAGDVLGVSVAGTAGYVSVFDTAGTEVHGSGQDATFLYPPSSPLPGGGNAVTDHVVRTAGTHYVEITAGDGSYEARLEAYRSGGARRRTAQTIVLDTDGQRLNTGIFGGRGVTQLSPLSTFLPRWGLPASSERALVQRLKAVVQENLDADLRAAGLSSSVAVNVVTSLDGPVAAGTADVTRIVVGGTIEESGVPTIGIAQSIDPGNFERAETGLVLLDLLSEPGDLDEAPYSLNSYLRPQSDRLAFVGTAVGNVVAHEVGHMIGNWHVDETNEQADLMDAGGNFPLLFGVGPDGVGGTADDPDVDFGRDRFNLFERFTGIEDTQARSVFALTTRPGV